MAGFKGLGVKDAGSRECNEGVVEAVAASDCKVTESFDFFKSKLFNPSCGCFCVNESDCNDCKVVGFAVAEEVNDFKSGTVRDGSPEADAEVRDESEGS